MPTDVLTNLHHLKLPSSVLYNDGGFCVDDIPVHFLVNKKSHCVRTISKELCQQNTDSLFSALKYVVADSTDSTLGHLLPVVTSDNFGHNVTNTSVNYLCLKNGSDYVTFSKNVFNKLIFWSKDEFIDQNEDISPCDALLEDIKLTEIIEQDDVCHNVLVSTSYEFMWSKGEIHNLHAVYLLANIPLSPASFINSKYGMNIEEVGGNSSSHFRQNVDYLNSDIENVHTYVTQHFSVKFTHVRLVDTDAGNITQEEILPVSFSGNPGYEVSRPLVVVMNNSLENDTFTEWKWGMVGVWSKGKKCEDILPVNFGYDVITTCSIELTLEDQLDCQVLRSHVLEVQELLISGEYITRGGADYRGDNTSIPVERLVPILRSTQTNWSDVSDTGHTCSDVPARHILELLYTTALGTQGQPIHQVVGARTRIDTETWPLNVNLEDTTISHDFLLTSSVVFVQVPMSDSPPRSRFWDRMLSQEHSENAWRNIFSALEPMTTGHEIAEVSVFTMSLVLLAVSLTALLWDQL